MSRKPFAVRASGREFVVPLDIGRTTTSRKRNVAEAPEAPGGRARLISDRSQPRKSASGRGLPAPERLFDAAENGAHILVLAHPPPDATVDGARQRCEVACHDQVVKRHFFGAEAAFEWIIADAHVEASDPARHEMLHRFYDHK